MLDLNIAPVFCILSLFVDKIFADNHEGDNFHCEFGTCQPKQYCCGENECCDRLADLWIFWFGIVVILIIAILITCVKIMKYYRKRNKNARYKYTSLLQES